MTLTNWLTALGFLAGVVSLINFSRTKPDFKSVLKTGILITIAVVIVILTFVKDGKDKITSQVLESKSDSVHLLLRSLNDSTLSISRKLSTIGVLTDYIKKVDSIGIKRDTLKNAPIITKAFNNYINKVGTLNQY